MNRDNFRKHLILLFIFTLVWWPGDWSFAQNDRVFEEYRQILPRGRIAAVVQPVYVSADSAEIDDKTWVFGVVIDGNPRAYSLNLLNSHEVVNDVIDTTHFAAVW